MFGDLAAGTALAGVAVQLARWPGTAFTACLSVFSAVATLVVSALRTRCLAAFTIISIVTHRLLTGCLVFVSWWCRINIQHAGISSYAA